MKKRLIVSALALVLFAAAHRPASGHDGVHSDTHQIVHYSYNGIHYVQFIFDFHTAKLWRFGNHYYRARVAWTYASDGWSSVPWATLFDHPQGVWGWTKVAGNQVPQLCPHFGPLADGDFYKDYCWDPDGIYVRDIYYGAAAVIWQDADSCSRQLYEAVRWVPHGTGSTWVPFITNPAQNSLNSVICEDIPCLGYARWCDPVHENPCPFLPEECPAP